MPLVVGGKKVASLYADIGANTTSFEAGATAVKSELGAMGTQMDGFSGTSMQSMASLGLSIGAVWGILKAGGEIFKEVITKTQEYDQEIYSIMASTGGTAEATSRFVQTLDDMGIGVDVAKKALKEMSKDGTEPNTESLAKLSDQFLALNSGADRGQFLLDKFGKSGMDMARAMELGGDKIRSMSQNVESSLIVTDKAIAASEEYRKNLDDLKDSADGFFITLGNEGLPILNQNIAALKGISAAQNEVEAQTGRTDLRSKIYIGNLIDIKNRSMEAADATAAHGDALDGVIPIVDEAGNVFQTEAEKIAAAKDSMEAMTKANSDMLGLTMNIQKETDNYNNSLAEQTAKQAELAVQIQEATTKYGGQSKQVLDLKGKYDAMDAGILKLKKDHTDAMNKITYDLLVAKLKADGFSDAEYQMALAAGVSLGQIDQSSADSAAAMNTITNAVLAAGGSMQAFGGIMQSVLQDGIVTAGELAAAMARINAGTAAPINIGGNTQQGGVAPQPGGTPTHAAGGFLSGPGDGSSDTFTTSAANGEFLVNSRAAQRNSALLQAINGGQDISNIGGGGGLTLYNYGVIQVKSSDISSGVAEQFG